jgi:hypothetical protein
VKNGIKIALFMGIILILSGCICKEYSITTKEQILSKKDIQNITKIEYSTFSSSMAPEKQRERTIIITKELAQEKLYSDYGDVLLSKGSMKIKNKDFDKLKQSLESNQIFSCNVTRKDCYGKVVPSQIVTGCSGEALSLYIGDKKIFSHFKSCDNGELCGNYQNFFNLIENLTMPIVMQDIIIKLVEKEPMIVFKEPQKLKLTLYLKTDKYDLDEYNIKKLNDFISNIKDIKKITVNIRGNTDRFGSQEYNYYKGLKRAKFVEKIFIGRGFKKENIISLSYGESNPVCVEITQECHDKNRRVDIEIY